jgi:hypothetical protein
VQDLATTAPDRFEPLDIAKNQKRLAAGNHDDLILATEAGVNIGANSGL